MLWPSETRKKTKPPKNRTITRPVITISAGLLPFCLCSAIELIAQFERFKQARIARGEKGNATKTSYENEYQKRPDRKKRQQIQNAQLKAFLMQKWHDGDVGVQDMHPQHPERNRSQKFGGSFGVLE